MAASGDHAFLWLGTSQTRSATTEIARDADDDFSVDDVHSALTLAFWPNSFPSDHNAQPPNRRFCYDEPWNGHSRSIKVIRRCANRRGIYDLILALCSNLTYIFNRYWDITPSLHIHIPPLPGRTEKRRLGLGFSFHFIYYCNIHHDKRMWSVCFKCMFYFVCFYCTAAFVA